MSEKPSTHYNKEVVMNGFAKYISARGVNAYIPEIKTQLPRCKYIPHIYTKDEVRRFFAAIDNYPKTMSTSRSAVDPVLFRFLYCTGARLSEALNLRVKDINQMDGYVVVLNAKMNKDRVIPLAETMMGRLKTYLNKFHGSSAEEAIVFPGRGWNRMNNSTAYNRFRDYLLMAGIPHTGKGPRIHDFRHGVAVENLRRWSEAGEDLSNMLPYLTAYMGHADFRATQYYLRLTAEIYPELVAQVEKHCGDVVPELEGFCYEEA